MRTKGIRAIVFGFLGMGLLSTWHGAGGEQTSSSNRANLEEAKSGSAFSITRVRLSPDSEADDWGIGTRGRNFWAVHVTLNELIGWAYGMNARQIDHAPDWLATERFDVDGLPDDDKALSGDQYRSMLRAALEERFALKFHSSEKILSVYTLLVADAGISVPRSADQNGKASWGVHRGWLSVTNMTFDSVAKVLQRTVFDRPVLDQTGLKDRYSFILKWRADDTQFGQMQGLEVPEEQGTGDVEDIYTAARQQLGLKLQGRRELAPTMVIDAVSRPTPN